MSATSTETRTSPTPILDRLAPLPPAVSPHARRRLALVALVAFALPVALALFDPLAFEALRRRILGWHDQLFTDPWTIASALRASVSLVLAFFLAVMVHELGHLVAGLCVGFRFSQLRVGPLQIDRPFHVSLQRSPGSGYFGWVSLFPARRDRLLARAVVLVLVLGGPGINLVSAALLLALPLSKGLFAWSFLAISLGLGIRELLPIRRRVAVSDGRRIWLMFRDPGWGRRWLALMKLGAELREGVLPEGLSPDYLAEAIAHRDESPDTVTAHALAYAAAFHQRKDAAAAGFLETALRYSGSCPPFQREALMSDAAVFQARRRRNPELAQQWLAAMPEPKRSGWLRTRGEAAILEARGDVGGALAKLEELEPAYRGLPDRAAGRVLLQLLERWRADLRQVSGAPA